MHAGSRVEISETAGVIAIAPRRPLTRIEERNGVLVAVIDVPVAQLDADAVRATLEAVRERRM